MSVNDSLINLRELVLQSTPCYGVFNSPERILGGGEQAALGNTVEDKLHC